MHTQQSASAIDDRFCIAPPDRAKRKEKGVCLSSRFLQLYMWIHVHQGTRGVVAPRTRGAGNSRRYL